MPKAVTVRFDLVWRAGASDTLVASTTHGFEPHPAGPDQYSAILFETDLAGSAVPASPGDELVLRFTTVSGGSGAYYIPDGDGRIVKGRIVNVTLPP